MNYAVFVYSLPLEEGGDPAAALAELIATEGVQREPVVMTAADLETLEQTLEGSAQ